jgi:hypothetical protein
MLASLKKKISTNLQIEKLNKVIFFLNPDTFILLDYYVLPIKSVNKVKE